MSTLAKPISPGIGKLTRYRAWRNLPLYLMLLPAAVILILFNYAPMLGLVMAFEKYKPLMGFFKSAWVGLDNFKRMIELPVFASLIRNTMVIAAGKIVLGQVAALAFALLLHEVKHAFFKRSIQTITYALYFLSWILFGGILLDLLASDGPVNGLITGMGFPLVQFLTNSKIFPGTLIFTDIWKGFGMGAVLYLAALADVDKELYEAAAVDGATRLGRLWNVTLPGILPTVVVLACLSLGGLLDAGMDQVLVLYNPSVYSTGDVIGTWVYRVGLNTAQYSLGAAVGMVQSVVGLVLVSVSYYLAYRLAHYRVF